MSGSVAVSREWYERAVAVHARLAKLRERYRTLQLPLPWQLYEVDRTAEKLGTTTYIKQKHNSLVYPQHGIAEMSGWHPNSREAVLIVESVNTLNELMDELKWLAVSMED